MARGRPNLGSVSGVHARYGGRGPATTRRVWAAVTRDPRASVRTIASEVGCTWSTVAAHLRRLRALGYISYQDRERRARIILVGFYVGLP